MFRISKAAMDTSLERIRAKIAELEAKLADLRIAERAILIGVRQAYYLQWTTIVVLPLLADTRLKNLMACDVASLIQPWLAFRPMEWPA
jgi:hypothetical protein